MIAVFTVQIVFRQCRNCLLPHGSFRIILLHFVTGNGNISANTQILCFVPLESIDIFRSLFLCNFLDSVPVFNTFFPVISHHGQKQRISKEHSPCSFKIIKTSDVGKIGNIIALLLQGRIQLFLKSVHRCFQIIQHQKFVFPVTLIRS